MRGEGSCGCSARTHTHPGPDTLTPAMLTPARPRSPTPGHAHPGPATLTPARPRHRLQTSRVGERVNGKSLRTHSPAPIRNTPATHPSGQGLPENGSRSCGLLSPWPSSGVLWRGLAGAIRMDGTVETAVLSNDDEGEQAWVLRESFLRMHWWSLEGRSQGSSRRTFSAENRDGTGLK